MPAPGANIMTTEHKLVIITVDGACLGNGQTEVQTRAAAAGILNYQGRRRAVAEFIGQSTNQRAEIIAAAVGLESLKESCTVIIRSDSKYVVQTMKGEFKRRTNLDLWLRLDQAAARHTVTYEWVKGHNGDPEQEAADTIARATAELGHVNEVILTEIAQRLQNQNIITPVLRSAVAEGLTYLANDCDGAKKRDGVGFNKFDTDLGHRLAAKASLSINEFAVGRRLLRRYTAQLAYYNPTIAAII
jgi:ribonuclease HI